MRKHINEMCSGSEAGSYLRPIDFVNHSTLGLRVIKKKRMKKHTEPLIPTTDLSSFCQPAFQVPLSGFPGDIWWRLACFPGEHQLTCISGRRCLLSGGRKVMRLRYLVWTDSRR